jgi:hypothetical protein
MLTPDHLRPIQRGSKSGDVRHVSCYTINEDVIHLILETTDKTNSEGNFGTTGWDNVPMVCLFNDDGDEGTTVLFPGLIGWSVVHVGGGDEVVVVFLRDETFNKSISLPIVPCEKEAGART